MTRSERNNLLAILTAIVLIVAGIIVTVIFGVKDPQVPDTDQAAEGTATTAEATPQAPEPDPVAASRVNRIHPGEITVPEEFDEVVHIRSWDGELTVWPGSTQIILGPAGNWFPAGQPGCGDGRYVVEFVATGEIAASIRDEVGETTYDAAARTGWMLLDDCHLPYLTAPTQADVTYEVHEFQPAG